MAKNKQNQPKNNKNRKEVYEPLSPPVQSCKDACSQQKSGGRCTPNRADAPNGMSDNRQ